MAALNLTKVKFFEYIQKAQDSVCHRGILARITSAIDILKTIPREAVLSKTGRSANHFLVPSSYWVYQAPCTQCGRESLSTCPHTHLSVALASLSLTL
jgi:hypothetical protein